MTASMRRSHGGIRLSRATRRRSGSGPPSIRRRPPREPSTRIASPCPTSRTETRATPAGRAATTAPATASATTRARTPARRAAVPCCRLGSAEEGRPLRAAVTGVGFTCGVAARSRRRAHHVTTQIPPAVVTAAMTSSGGPSVTLANGRPAAVSTTATRVLRIDPPGSAEDRTDDLRPAGEDKRATTERDDPGRHRRRNQRDHDEVDDR